MPDTFKNFIGGQWVGARSGATFENRNPADTDELIGLFAKSDRDDTREAIAAAAAAQPAWAAMPAPKRGEVLYRAANLLEARADHVAREMTREEGKTLPEARGEVGRAINILRYFGGEGARLGGQHAPSERDRVFIQTRRRPLGVVGLITPWNFPIAIPTWKTAPALIAGNAVVLKPSDLAPLCALRMVEALDEAGVTKGAINLVTGPGSKVGAEIVENTAVRAISFTGSEATGSGIAIEAAKRRSRVQLEMGGKNPTIVLADAQIPDAVNVVVNAAFFSTGQRCTATSRVIVEEPIVERFTAALVERTRALKVGNGLEAGIEIGPSIDDKQLATVLDYVGVGQTEGARVACGGARLSDGAHSRGYFSSPAVLTDVAPSMRVAQEEIFGPVLAVLAARSLDHAVEVANGIRYGLSAAICTTSLTSAYEFINRIEAGLVMVNLPSAGVEYHVPFGGSKQSSLGMREQGPVAVDFYSEIQTAYVKYSRGRLHMRLFNTIDGLFVEHDGGWARLDSPSWDEVVNRDDLFDWLQHTAGSSPKLDAAPDLSRVLPPIGSQEVWAAGVTYFRSRTARMEESKSAGGGDFYDRVYAAERPELFFKATPHRVRGHGDPVRIRRDARWNVPEPELTLVITSGGAIVGYTIGNDMSSRDIEGENPLYLPQAKVYDGSCAIGPAVFVTKAPLAPTVEIRIAIRRAGQAVFAGSTTLAAMKRTPEDLVSYLYRETSFASGCLLLTGTGIVPPDDFTLAAGDEIAIGIDHIGTLVNRVA